MSTSAFRLPRRRPRSARAWAWLIVLALVAVQTLGALHGVAHASRAGQAVADASAAIGTSFEPGAAAEPSPHSISWLDAVFGANSGGHDCKAFDQASHADLVGTAPSMAVFAAPAVAPACVRIAWHLAAQASGFLARGPPVAS